MSNMDNWTDTRIDLLKAHYASGLSFSQIAAAINAETKSSFSRNAIIGKVHRLGLDGRERPKAKPRVRRVQTIGRAANVTYASRIARMKLNAHAAMVPVFDVIEPPPLQDTEIPQAQRRSLLDLSNHHCRWPVGDPGTPDFFFCGDPSADVAGGKPYCPAHAKRARNKPATDKSQERYAANVRPDRRKEAA